jgi:hypothetical protein
MNLSLTDITIVPQLSEETTCFSATVLVDGKPAFTVKNRGQGGPNEHAPYRSGVAADRQLLAKAHQWAESLPPVTYEFGSTTVTVPSDLDCVIDDLLLKAIAA